jgi:DNA-binding NarL/FixJ family response regulator
MPVMDGYAAAREIKECCPACRVIALSVHSEPAARAKAEAAGCDGFIEKGIPLASILEAVRAGATDPDG